MYIGVGATGTAGYLNGCVARISYYPTRFPNATLQLLSDYTPPATLDLNFAGTASLPSTVTFSRGTNATVVDSTGAVAWAPHNLLTYSEQFNNATAWSQTSVIVNPDAIIAPNGSLTADKLLEDNTNNTHGVGPVALTFLVGIPYTASVYVKAAERTSIIFGVGITAAFSSYQYGKFDLLTGAASIFLGSPGVAITSVGNGWYRCSVTVTPTATGVDTFSFQMLNAVGNNTYIGTTGYGVYVWGAQVNAGALQPYNQTTSATYYGPRFDYDPITLACKGLLIEEARTNIVASYTYTASANGWSNGVIGGAGTVSLAPSVTAPNNAVGSVYTVANLNNVSYVSWFTTATTSTNTYTASIYVKNNGGTKAQIRLVFSGGTYLSYATEYTFATNTFVDAPSGTTAPLSRSAVIVNNGWVRITITGANNGSVGNTGNQVLLWGPTTPAECNYSFWGAQVEVGAFATSVIPTTAAAATRNADVAQMTGTNFSSWYNQTQGTFVVKGDANALSTGSILVAQISGGGNRHQITPFTNTTATVNGSVVQANMGANTSPTFITSYGYATSNFGTSTNGAAPDTSGSGTVPNTLNYMVIGSFDFGGNTYLSGHIARITYYPTRLSNATLQALTA
jgi:hypothetical protein